MTETVSVAKTQYGTATQPTLDCPACRATDFDCEACLHQHLVSTHGVRYSQVYGLTPGEWSQPCPSSSAGSVLGL